MKKSNDHRERRETVLVVDDDPAILVLVRTILMGEDYRVLLANGSESALRLIEQEHWGVDLVLIDVCMPEMNGVEMARLVRSLKPDLRILFMSGFTDHEIIRVNVLDEGLGFLPKPFRTSGLLEKVRQALDAPTSPNEELVTMVAG